MVCTYNSLNECQEHQEAFPSTTPDIMVTANLENVVPGTDIDVRWIYQEGELPRSVDIADTVFRKSDESITSMYAILRRPDNGWPQGKYEVVLQSDERDVEPVRQNFSIEALNSFNSAQFPSDDGKEEDTSASRAVTSSSVSDINSAEILGNVTFCQLDERDTCLTEMALLPTTRAGVRVKANVSRAPVGTTVEAQWRYLEEDAGRSQDIQTVAMTKNDAQDTWVQSSLKKPREGWPLGQYEVALRIVPEPSDIAVKRFFVQ